MEEAAKTAVRINPGQNPEKIPWSKQVVSVNYIEILLQDVVINELS